jgi:hypothetical protein
LKSNQRLRDNEGLHKAGGKKIRKIEQVEVMERLARDTGEPVGSYVALLNVQLLFLRPCSGDLARHWCYACLSDRAMITPRTPYWIVL